MDERQELAPPAPAVPPVQVDPNAPAEPFNPEEPHQHPHEDAPLEDESGAGEKYDGGDIPPVESPVSDDQVSEDRDLLDPSEDL